MKALLPLLALSGLVALAVTSATAEVSARRAHVSSVPDFRSPDTGMFGRDGISSRASRTPALPSLKVAFTLTAQGEPTAIRVLAGTGDAKIDQECVATLAATRLKPQRVNGVAVASEQVFQLKPSYRS